MTSQTNGHWVQTLPISILLFKNFIYFLWVFHLCVFYHISFWYYRSQKRMLNPLEMELQTIVSYHEDAGTRTKCSYLLSHLSNPQIHIVPSPLRMFLFIWAHSATKKQTNIEIRKIEIALYNLSDHLSERKLELNSKRNYRKCTNTWKLSNLLFNHEYIIEISTRKFINS